MPKLQSTNQRTVFGNPAPICFSLCPVISGLVFDCRALQGACHHIFDKFPVVSFLIFPNFLWVEVEHYLFQPW